ncbi:MAG: DUF3417 domain-containing protein, partial [Muribaculum sp.]|nr:DUF3417 domain-containing protein [Muribaculum sp.]
DYIDRFYNKEAKRTAILTADNYAVAKQIVAWKEKIAAAWNDIKVISIDEASVQNSSRTGDHMKVTVKVDGNGIANDLGLECVIYRLENGTETLEHVNPFQLESIEGNIVTFTLDSKMRESGMFRYAYRLYPKNDLLPHRMDFAFTRWI